MHTESLHLMRRVVDEYLLSKGDVLDIASYDVNGTYKPLFQGWNYLGVDTRPGPNVDVVVGEGVWNLGKKFDAVVCGNALHNVRRPWELMERIKSHLAPHGHCCLIAPMELREPNEHPQDYWRFRPDGMAELLWLAGCETLLVQESRISRDRSDVLAVGRVL